MEDARNGRGDKDDEAVVDWDSYQDLLDDLFHRPDDAYPARSSEYQELQEFITKLTRFRDARPPSAPPSESSHPSAELAEQLGIPVR
eukprot:jgi/Mesen1/203/ME1138689C07602